jgi:hypothetical protein
MVACAVAGDSSTALWCKSSIIIHCTLVPMPRVIYGMTTFRVSPTMNHHATLLQPQTPQILSTVSVLPRGSSFAHCETPQVHLLYLCSLLSLPLHSLHFGHSGLDQTECDVNREMINF